ncbi:MAG: sulfite exporter TauE/SafE family protein [Planctomycetaceae bacterium]|jgi:uncharacterized membrane protein YfcA|nr:sulfite exporter TauE/SafE family protein [Planctomycetaceae bacterium]
MDFSIQSIIFGLLSALFFGMSKTGIPGGSIPGVLLMTLAFPGMEKFSTGAVVPLLIVGDLFAVRYYRHTADWKRIRLLLPSVFIGLLFGTAFLWMIDNVTFKIFLGVMILVLIAFEEVRRRLQWNTFPKSRLFAWSMGLLSGFTTQTGNAAGPVMSVYLSAQNMEKKDFMGTWSVFFFIVNVSKLPLISGFIPGFSTLTRETLLFDLVVLPALLIGVFIGRQIFKWIPERYFVPLIMILNLLVPIQMLVFR